MTTLRAARAAWFAVLPGLSMAAQVEHVQYVQCDPAARIWILRRSAGRMGAPAMSSIAT